MALSVKAELQLTGLGGGDIGVDGVPWQYATVADLKTLLYEELRLPASARKDDLISIIFGSAGQLLSDGDKLSDPQLRGKKLIVRGAELPPTPVRRPWFATGVEVLLHGLQGAPELNGKRAVVAGWDALKCRCDVIMDSTKLRKSVKPDNMQWAWVSPLLVGQGAGDSRSAHVPMEGAFQPTRVSTPAVSSAWDALQAAQPASYSLQYDQAAARGGPGSALSGAALSQAGAGAQRGGYSLPAAGSQSGAPPPKPAAVAAPPAASRGAAASGGVSSAPSRSPAHEPGGPPADRDLSEVLQELEGLKLEKERAISEEDFDRAGAAKRRQQELLAGLGDLAGKLKAAREELESAIADKKKAVEEEDFKKAKELKARQSTLEERVRALEDWSASTR